MQNQYIFQRTICKHGNTFALATKTSLNMWLFKSESKSLAWNLNSANSSLASKYIKLIFHTLAHKFPRTQTCPTVPGALLSLTSMGHKEQECKETFPSQHLHLPNKLIFQVVKLKRKKKNQQKCTSKQLFLEKAEMRALPDPAPLSLSAQVTAAASSHPHAHQGEGRLHLFRLLSG